MQVDAFDFELPEDLVATVPLARRRESRLLALDRGSGELWHRTFPEILELLQPGDLLVFNDTKVIPARLEGQKETGGRVELLLERVLGADRAWVQLGASKSPKIGTKLYFEPDVVAVVLGRSGQFFELTFEGPLEVGEIFQRYGTLPLPHYMKRRAGQEDQERYQTVYARAPGAVAAPTAGLHFDRELMNALKSKGVKLAYVTLHVGAGTFLPVKVAQVEDHPIHTEI